MRINAKQAARQTERLPSTEPAVKQSAQEPAHKKADGFAQSAGPAPAAPQSSGKAHGTQSPLEVRLPSSTHKPRPLHKPEVGLFDTRQKMEHAARPRPLRVLITGFEAFGGSADNPSGAAAKALDDKKLKGAIIEGIILPVEYDKAAAKIKEAMELYKPDVVISLGMAGGEFQLETRGENLDNTPGFADNAGVIREGHKITDKGPEFLMSTLPIAEIDAYVEKATGVNPVLSNSAGNYVCNNTLYHLLEMTRGTGVQAGFIHVPAPGVVPQKTINTVIEKAVEAIAIQHRKDQRKKEPVG